MMTHYLLRIEGVNLYGFIGDTNDLSTIRGAGLQLLDVVKSPLSSGIEGVSISLEPVSLGASVGVFEFESPDDAAEIADRIKRALDNHPIYRHATLMVTVQPSKSTYQQCEASTVAAVRWAQLQSPTVTCRTNQHDWRSSLAAASGVAIPAELSESDAHKRDKSEKERQRLACGIDHLRPATAWLEGPSGDAIKVSDSTAVRKTYGRFQKQNFYRRLFQEQGLDASLGPKHYATEFAQLAQVPTKHSDRHADVASLDRKLAVIYFDGNSFGSKIRSLCSTSAKHRKVDRALRNSRAAFLCELLQENSDSEQHPFWYSSDKSGLRFQLETLLWGGDEIIWVVPAWQGWQLAMRFFGRWHVPRESGLDKLTHAAGLAFCNVKAPIHRITHLIKSLAEQCKSLSRERNLLAYEVLESFDHTGQDLAEHRKRRAPVPSPQSSSRPLERPRAPEHRILDLNRPAQGQAQAANADSAKPEPDRLTLSLAQMQSVDALVRTLKATSDFPRGRMRSNVMRAMQADARYQDCKEKADALCQLRWLEDSPDAQTLVERAIQAFDGDPVLLWHHVCALWDYLGLSIHADSSPFELPAPSHRSGARS